MIDTSCESGVREAMEIPPVPQLIPVPPMTMTAPVHTSFQGVRQPELMQTSAARENTAAVTSSDDDDDDVDMSNEVQAFTTAEPAGLAYLRSLAGTNSPSSLHSKAMSESSEVDTHQTTESEGSPSQGQNSDSRKPKVSFIAMITMAIRSSPKQKATLSQIYDFIRQNFPYYDADGSNWQNSIRHNLSLNACFAREARKSDDPGKGSYWKIDPVYGDMFRNGYQERRKKRVKKVPLRPRPPRRLQSFTTQPMSHLSSPSTPPTPPITPEQVRKNSTPSGQSVVQQFRYPNVTSPSYTTTVMPTHHAAPSSSVCSPYSVAQLISATPRPAIPAQAPIANMQAPFRFVQMAPNTVLVRPGAQQQMPIVFVQQPCFAPQHSLVQYGTGSPTSFQ